MGKKLALSTEWINRPFLRNTSATKEQHHLYTSNGDTTVFLLEDNNDDEEEDSSNDDSHSSDDTELLLRQNPLSEPPPSQQQLSKLRIAKLLFGVIGIYGAYLSYGLYQEDLYRYKGEDGTTVRCVWLLQVLESAASIALGGLGRTLWGGTRNVPLRPFLLSGAAQVFAKVFMSLSLVMGASFPIATLAKSAKIVPVRSYTRCAVIFYACSDFLLHYPP
jgi:UAA transporter family